MPDFQLGYCLGLIAGEGSFSRMSANGEEYPRLSVSVSACDSAMLAHLVKQFGGRINGPYAALSGVFITWYLVSKPLCDAIPIILEHMPSCHKREQMLVWLERHKEYFNNPPKPRLKYSDAEDIRRAYRAGADTFLLAEIYNVSRSNIYGITSYNTHLGK